MDEVLRIKKGLDKADNDPKRALDLLRCLESIPMTFDVLKQTQIGMSVNKIRKSIENPEVSSLSKSMIKKWKKLLSPADAVSASTAGDSKTESSKSNPSKNNNSSSTNLNSDKSTSNNSISKSKSSNSVTNSTDQATTPPTPKPRPEDTRAPTSKEAPYTSCEVRLKCRTLIAEALKKPLPNDMLNEPFLEEEDLASHIEESIFQEFRKTDMKYKNRVRSRVANLGDSKNPYLRWNVLKGDISANRIAKMTAEEMASDELKKEREKFTKEAINDHQMSHTTGTKTSEIKCPACRKYDVTYNQVQTRSADEPMTTFCYCNLCGKRWKFC